MAKYAQYEILYGQDLYTLEDRVLEALNDGWEPVGGVEFGKDGEGEPLWAQAVVRG